MTHRAEEAQIQSYRGGFGLFTGFTSAGGASDNVTTALATLLSTITKTGGALPLQAAAIAAWPYTPGVVTGSPGNKVTLRDANGDYIQDGSGRDVYGRIGLVGAVWTVTYYSMVGGTETAFTTMPAGQTLAMAIPLVFDWADYPVSSDLLMLEFDLSPETGTVGRRPFAENLAVTVANTLPALTNTPVGEVKLVVNAMSYSSFDTTPAFTVAGKAITWSAPNSFTLAPGSNVIANYNF